MKKYLAILVLLFAGLADARAQILTAPTSSVKKYINEPATFSWGYAVADEAVISHFELVQTEDLLKPATVLATFPKIARSGVINAAFLPGFKFVYYALVAVDARDTANVLHSAPSNTVSVERVGKPPTNLTVE